MVIPLFVADSKLLVVDQRNDTKLAQVHHPQDKQNVAAAHLRITCGQNSVNLAVNAFWKMLRAIAFWTAYVVLAQM